jgi:hypothetical protein
MKQECYSTATFGIRICVLLFYHTNISRVLDKMTTVIRPNSFFFALSPFAHKNAQEIAAFP